MTKRETTEFLEKLKVEYPMLPIKEKYFIEEWYKSLKDYDAYDVYLKLEEHLNGDLKNNPPKPSFITKYLKTTNEKLKPAENHLIDCNLCQKTMRLNEYEKHYDRCLATIYLQNVLEKKYKEKLSYEELYNLSDGKFNLLYEKYK